MAKRKNVTQTVIEKKQEFDQQAWDDLIARTKIIQQGVDQAYWQLILIVGEIDTKYGESRIGRWADECNIGRSTAYKYRRLALAGVNEKFVKQYGELGFQKVYQIYEIRRSLDSKSAIEWLNYAKENPKMNSGILLSHLERRVRPYDTDKEFEESQKKADKLVTSVRNRFGDFAADVLSRTLDEMPTPIEAAEEGLGFEIVVETADRNAGKKYRFYDREEQEQEQTIDKLLKRSKDWVRWLTSNYDDLFESLSLPHEKGDELRGELSATIRLLTMVLEAERAPLPELPEGRIVHLDRRRALAEREHPQLSPSETIPKKGNTNAGSNSTRNSRAKTKSS